MAGLMDFDGMVTESGDLIVLAVQRAGMEIAAHAAEDSGGIVLQAGDTMLLQGTWKDLDVHLRPVLMSTAVAAAGAFLAPIATPTNLMVMGPGGNTFSDCWKLGLPLLIWFSRSRFPSCP